MAVADELARREDRRREFRAIDDRVEAALEQADQILAGVALHARSLEIVLLELLFGDVAVIALQLLLGAELDAEIRHLALAALTVLAGAIFAAVDRALRAAPDVFTHPAVEFILGALALRHLSSPICCVPKDFGVSRVAPYGDKGRLDTI